MKKLLVFLILTMGSLQLFCLEIDPLLAPDKISIIHYERALKRLNTFKKTAEEKDYAVAAIEEALKLLTKEYALNLSSSKNTTSEESTLERSIKNLEESHKDAIAEFEKACENYHKQGVATNNLVTGINKASTETYLFKLSCGVCRVYGKDPLELPYNSLLQKPQKFIATQPK